ncbi:MAG: pyruvate ferredoxin oxidoreductase [Chloroflexi bacterium]|jgi:pyruvate ferredoxin oxidoreductase alpha subunit|nr:pyruvate ferredoxin oxidoreductase [Chloroflexota bacterium]MBT7080701.1 pyruvate ferredoxin oxidoreductase [Chloroflexota bacterium]MBT7290271.1 pyruvate ferredoxin oxidoreductase [Chloroflexota bacterium]
MAKKVGTEVSFAVADAVKLADVDVIAAYPITPQTHIVEKLSEYVADGELDAEYICVESEHSAMSACCGSSATGARTFTATAGQGLELMHEVLTIPASSRLPMVAAICNRALSGPLSVWGDHSDLMGVRDTGWIQIIAENGQDVHDLTIAAFKISEHKDVMFPVMVHMDGFHLTHVIEPIVIMDQEDVDKFLPPFEYNNKLDPASPVSQGTYAPPHIYPEIKKAQDVALVNSKETIKAIWKEYGDLFGRYYNPIETYKTDDAETILVTMGSFSETASLAIDKLREQGKKVGLLRVRLWRPFPFAELRDAAKSAKTMIVLDRALSFGGPAGPLCSEIRSAFYQEKNRPQIISFISGLGGRDIDPEDFEAMIARGEDIAKNGSDSEYEILGVRE